MLCGYDNCYGEMVCGKVMENPNYGLISFDTIFYSFLYVFQCITLEGWTQIMFYYVRTFSIYMVFFFIPLVWVGAYFLVNLTLAVINTTFNQSIDKTDVKVEEKAEVDENSVITIEDIRNMKLGERSHHKRTLRISGITKLYGASEDDKQAEKLKFDLRWEDLFELKERIIEEQERAEAEENFNKLRELELDKKQKIKKKAVNRSNMKYLPKPSKNNQLKDLHVKMLPLKYLTTQNSAYLKEKNKKRSSIKIMEICGVDKAALLNKNEIGESEGHTQGRASNYQLKKAHINVKKPSVFDMGSPQLHPSARSTVSEISPLMSNHHKAEEDEDIFLKKIDQLPKDDVKLKDGHGIDIFSLKNTKKTKFFVKLKSGPTLPSIKKLPTKSLVESISRKDFSQNLSRQRSLNKIEANKVDLRQKIKRTNTHEIKAIEAEFMLPHARKRASEKVARRSGSLIEKNSKFTEYLIEKLNKEDNILKINDLDISSSSISSESSNLSDSFLNDSDFNIGFVEKPEKVKKPKNKKVVTSKKELARKKSTVKEKQGDRKMSKKTSIIISDTQSIRSRAHSRTSKMIMSSLMLDLKKAAAQKESDNDDKEDDDEQESGEEANKQSNNHFESSNNNNNTPKPTSDVRKKSIIRKQSTINNTVEHIQLKDQESKDKIQEVTGPFNFNPRSKGMEKLAKRGFFKRIFTINSFRKSNKVQGSSSSEVITADMSPTRRRRGIGVNTDKAKTLKTFQKNVVTKRKKPNVLHYKLMINHEKNYVSTSQDDVREYRQEKERERIERELEEKIKSVKYGICYTMRKFKVKKLNKLEKKKQILLLKELQNSKKKSIDFQTLDRKEVLMKILNIKPESPKLPLNLRNNLMVVMNQQREILFGSKSRIKNLTSMSQMSPMTNVSMVSLKSPMARLKKENERSKKRKKKIVEIDEKLTYDEWKVKLKEKLNERVTKEEIEEVFSNRNDFMAIRVIFVEKK